MSLDDALRAAALARPDDVDDLAGLEDVRLHVAADLVLAGELGGHPRFVQVPLRRDLRLVEVPEQRLRRDLAAPLAEAELERRVAVVLVGLFLYNEVRARFQHRHRNRFAALIVDAGHADLAAEKLDRHREASEVRGRATRPDAVSGRGFRAAQHRRRGPPCRPKPSTPRPSCRATASGPEVTEAAVRVLDAAGVSFAWDRVERAASWSPSTGRRCPSRCSSRSASAGSR
jgi:hypothetical protein